MTDVTVDNSKTIHVKTGEVVGAEGSESELNGLLCTMPKALTAENGAKQLLIGEFYESITLQCNECHGLGCDDGLMPCDACDGAGDYSQRVHIEWTTIKEIYAMAVKHLST